MINIILDACIRHPHTMIILVVGLKLTSNQCGSHQFIRMYMLKITLVQTNWTRCETSEALIDGLVEELLELLHQTKLKY